MSIKLSICIPTYNRSEFLEETLESLLIAIVGYENVIEVLICDNASQDKTALVVADYQKKHRIIRYHKNDENIGAERNFYLAASLAKGEYIWIFGDDDKVECTAVKSIMEQINYRRELIICNVCIYNKAFTNVINNKYFNINEDLIILDHNKLMEIFGAGLSFISCSIIKKDIFLRVDYAEYQKFAEYGFSFLFAIYSSMYDACNAVFLHKPLILNRAGNSGVFDWCKYFVKGIALVLETLYGMGYKLDMINIARNKVITAYIAPYIANKKNEGVIIDYQYRETIRRYYDNCWAYWFILMPIYYLPVWILPMAKSVYKRIR